MRMNRKSGSGSGPFLMEMLVVTGFFIACASICVLVFVKADGMSQGARDLNQAVLAAESLAEELKVWEAGAMAQGQAAGIMAYGPVQEQAPEGDMAQGQETGAEANAAQGKETGPEGNAAQGQETGPEGNAGQGVKGSKMLPDRTIWEHLLNADALLSEQQAGWLEELQKSDGYEGIYTLYWDSRWKPTQPQVASPYLGIVRVGVVDHMRRADILIMCYGEDSDKGKVLYRLQTETYEKP